MAKLCAPHRKEAFARCLLCALSLQQVAWAACSRTPWLPSSASGQLSVPSESSLFYLTPENYSSVAALLATPRKEIILTALSFTHKGEQHVQQQLDFVKNFALHLHRLGFSRTHLSCRTTTKHVASCSSMQGSCASLIAPRRLLRTCQVGFSGPVMMLSA